MKYSDKKLKELKPKDKRYKIYLGAGLFLEVMTSGKKYFRCKYKTHTQTIGEFPKFTLLDAQVISKIGTEKVAVIKFEEVARRWFKKMCAEWSHAHTQKILQRLELYILPCLGSKNILEIKRKEIFSYFHDLEAQGKIDTCKRAVGIISAIFDYAMVCGECETNPATGLGKAFTFKNVVPRSAFTKEIDIKRLMISIFNYNGYISTKNLMLWTAYTFCRPSECRLAKWQEIDGNVWVVPKDRMKMGKEHIVPLSTQCIGILEEMQKVRKWIGNQKCYRKHSVISGLEFLGATYPKVPCMRFVLYQLT